MIRSEKRDGWFNSYEPLFCIPISFLMRRYRAMQAEEHKAASVSSQRLLYKRVCGWFSSPSGKLEASMVLILCKVKIPKIRTVYKNVTNNM